MLLRTASQEREFIARKFCKLSFLEGGECYGELMYIEASGVFQSRNVCTRTFYCHAKELSGTFGE